MKKSKKIIFLLIATVAIIATLAINTFAYQTNTYHSTSYNYLPNVSTLEQVTYNRTALPNNNNSITDGVIARAGDINNSVRIICTARNNYNTYFEDTGYLEYTMISAQPFQFTIDFGSIVSNLAYLWYENSEMLDPSEYENPYSLGVTIDMGVAEDADNSGYLTSIHSLDYLNGDCYVALNGVAMDDYGNIRYFSNRPDDDWLTTLETYLEFKYGSDGMTFANNISGYFYESFENYAHYYFARIRVRTYANRQDSFTYFIGHRSHQNVNTLADLNYMSSRLIREKLGGDLFDAGYREGESVGYNNGYTNGKTDGLIQGRNEGYEEGYDEGVDHGASNAIEEKGMFSFFIESIGALFKYPLFELPNGGNISLGLMLGVVLGASTLIWILKLFAGG